MSVKVRKLNEQISRTYDDQGNAVDNVYQLEVKIYDAKEGDVIGHGTITNEEITLRINPLEANASIQKNFELIKKLGA